jgi:molecular chaperone HtpG
VRLEFSWERIDQQSIETIEFLKDQFEFKIDTFKILELLTGHTLYNDSGVVIRELVQNSIDAVRLQFWDPTRKRSREEGRVAIHWDSQARVLTVADNGTGMSEEIIKKHLLEVGSSRYQDPRFQEAHPEFSSISRFGIGVLSTFMVADEVEYLTYFPGEEQARRLLLRSVHGKYLVRLLDKTDERVRHLVPHGTEVRLKLRHTAEMGDPVELAKKWIVVPDCSVTVQRDEGPVETIGFWTPKEALERILTKLRYDLAVDTGGPRIKVEQVEKNGVTLAYALEWSDYFREWTFLSVPEYRQPDSEVGADYLLGTCVEGIRVDTDSPGFRERNIHAIANATGRLAPRTNVARSGLEMSSEVIGLMRSLYSIYFSHVENEVCALQSERGFSPTWAAGEPVFIPGSLLKSQKERNKQVEIVDMRAFVEAAEEAKLVLVED